MILRSGILVEHLVQSNLTQNWALYSLPDSVVAAGGYEMNVCPCGKNGSHWPNYHGHWGKKEIQVLVEVSVSLFRQLGNWEKPPVTSRILKKTVSWEDIPGRKLRTDPEVGTSTSAWVSVTHQSSLTTVTGSSACWDKTCRNQPWTEDPWAVSLWSLHCPQTQEVPNWKFNIPPDNVTKQGTTRQRLKWH